MEIKKILTGLFTLLIVSIIGVTSVSAYNGGYYNNGNNYNMMGNGGCMGMNYDRMYNMNNMNSGMRYGMNNNNNMYDEMNTILNTGSYEDLESFRDKYNMPTMYWIQNEEDLKTYQENGYNMNSGMRSGMGYRMMR